MPLISFLAAPGSPCCFLRRSAHTCLSATPHQSTFIAAFRSPLLRPRCFPHLGGSYASFTHLRRKSRHSNTCLDPRHSCVPRRCYSTNDELPEDAGDVFTSNLGIGDGGGAQTQTPEFDQEIIPEPVVFRPQAPRRILKARRISRPGLVLDSIQSDARDLYLIAPPEKHGQLYIESQRKKLGDSPELEASSPPPESEHPEEELVSLYTILARHLRAITATPGADPDLKMNSRESSILESNGYCAQDVEQWASCLLTSKSISAAEVFRRTSQTPPFFLVLLFLRRQRIRSHALGIVMRHVSARVQEGQMPWNTLRLLTSRLLRHARVSWPESIPWIALFFTTEATRLYDAAKDKGRLSTVAQSGFGGFCNVLLSLLSSPASVRPVLSAQHQEKAQFQILQFMASCTPPLPVTHTGFRATTRNQLAHAKTAQEREWAGLRGPSWPPWKENRTAMDEEKGYEFGLSRASRIIHRMYEAGYKGHTWEQVAAIYAGWDIDFSPTIQTRTVLPWVPIRYRNKARHEMLLWAARIRATRTRREAWACFLASEESKTSSSSEVYQAMFEKLVYPEIEEGTTAEHDSDVPQTSSKPLLPGDMKETLQDPKSPLHLAYLSEPVPTYEQLFHRMAAKDVRLKPDFLALLVETIPNFSTALQLLESCQDEFDGGIRRLLEASTAEESSKSPVPEFFLCAFMRFLCRFGRFSQLPATDPVAITLEHHQLRFKLDQAYLLEYAYALLMRYRPAYRPAWTVYMEKVLFDVPKTKDERQDQPVAQYKIICRILEEMEEIDLDPDDDQFRLLCTVVCHAAQAAFRRDLTLEGGHHVLSTAPRMLRSTFHTLVGANVNPNSTHLGPDENAIPPHVPDPAVLHSYVRALGILRDYEGLYSFSSWIAAYHTQATARANAQHGGPQALYRTFVALRAAMEGVLVQGQGGASEDLIALVKAQIRGVPEWTWPSDNHVRLYVRNGLRGRSTPGFALGSEPV